jgi:molybdopterin synthase catalytic subunit
MMFAISDEPLDTAGLGQSLASPEAGALVTFEGRVRNRNDGRAVISLEYEAYRTLAEKEGNRILEEAAEQFDILGASVVHRVGQLTIGEPAVWIGVIAAHREAAFAACRFVIDQLKERVPIWKREYYDDGSTTWVGYP